MTTQQQNMKVGLDLLEQRLTHLEDNLVRFLWASFNGRQL